VKLEIRVQKNEGGKKGREGKAKKKAGGRPGNRHLFSRLPVCESSPRTYSEAKKFSSRIFDSDPNYSRALEARASYREISGVVWIDENDHQVARIEPYFVVNANWRGCGESQKVQFIDRKSPSSTTKFGSNYQEAHIGAALPFVKGIY